MNPLSTTLRKQLAGPPQPMGPLDFLAQNQNGTVDSQPQPSVMSRLTPLIAAQAMDLISTEKPFGYMKDPGAHEADPLPGMQTTAGRVGWNLGEALLAAMLLKHAPSIGNAYVTGSNIAHNAMVQQNQQAMKDAEDWRKIVGGR